ncbi:Transposon TX1 uncharacterized protein [Nymphaea thermarum]|nr:Transposon TX1 uncharacterized protein [Nymphaea thermarum]
MAPAHSCHLNHHRKLGQSSPVGKVVLPSGALHQLMGMTKGEEIGNGSCPLQQPRWHPIKTHPTTSMASIRYLGRAIHYMYPSYTKKSRTIMGLRLYLDVNHFHPISILGTPYKIIAKLLSMRLAPIMPSIINPFQVAFIKGRRLHDTVVLANEVVHCFYCLYLHSFIVKLDNFRASDSVSWKFLYDLLTRLNFGRSSREWILSLVTTQLAVSFNEMCGEFFYLGHSVKHLGRWLPHTTFTPHLQAFSTLQYADNFLQFDTASHQQIVRT